MSSSAIAKFPNDAQGRIFLQLGLYNQFSSGVHGKQMSVIVLFVYSHPKKAFFMQTLLA